MQTVTYWVCLSFCYVCNRGALDRYEKTEIELQIPSKMVCIYINILSRGIDWNSDSHKMFRGI